MKSNQIINNDIVTLNESDVRINYDGYINFSLQNELLYLPVFGDSMHPMYSSGDIISVKKINNIDVVLWGEAYFIITDESANNMRTVKLLFPHPDDDKVILRATNPNFHGDTVIYKSSILSIYLVMCKYSRKHL